jgi:hypothetical protein
VSIQPVTVFGGVAPAQALEPSEVSSSSSIAVTADAGPATTLWVSPPGVFFSLLHQISQRFPVELMTALAAFAEGAKAGGSGDVIDAGTLASLGSEVLHANGASTPRRASSPVTYSPATMTLPPPAAPAGASPTASAAPLAKLLETLRDLSHQNADAFDAIAVGLSGSFEAVASGATGPDASAMATLATQLALSAQMAPPNPDRVADGEPEAPAPSPTQAVARVASSDDADETQREAHDASHGRRARVPESPERV